MRIFPNKASFFKVTIYTTIFWIVTYITVNYHPWSWTEYTWISIYRRIYNVFPGIFPDVGPNHLCPRDLDGGIGNHMFSFASVYGLARHYNYTVILAQTNQLLKYFNLTHYRTVPYRFWCPFEQVQEKAGCIYDDIFMNLSRGTNYHVSDYFQSWRYFSHVVPEVRKQFEFPAEVQLPVDDAIAKIRNNSTDHKRPVIGVHIRLGDLITRPKFRRLGYQTAPQTYIDNAIEYFQNRTKDAVFMVCSDSIEVARTFFENKTIETHFSVSNSVIHDMALLASCDHVILTVGTFGWWSGFLNKGTVVYYKRPYREDSWIMTQFNATDFYPPYWIGLE